jgi:hypothetical protein
MIIIPVNNKYLRTYSQGVELEYRGKSIRYSDAHKTFIYYYYREHRRVYVIDGTERNVWLPQIDRAVRVVMEVEDRAVIKFARFTSIALKDNKNILYSLSDVFFHELYILANTGRKNTSEFIQLYNHYRGKM